MSVAILQLQLKGSQSNLYTQGQNIVFDTLLSPPITDIQYNSQTGTITIYKSGVYFISWWVSVETVVGNKQTVDLSLITSDGREFEADSPIKPSQVVGTGIIQVAGIPITVRLVNTADNTLTIGVNSTPQAVLDMFEITDNIGPMGPQGPTGIQGPTGLQGPTGAQGPKGDIGSWESAGVYLLNTIPTPSSEVTIASGGVIPFDNIKVQFNGVNYTNNQINISETGYYLITWEFIARPTETGSDIIVQLEGTKGATPIVYGKAGAISNDYGLITGTALVMINSIPIPNTFNLQIVNRSSSAIEMTAAYNREGDLTINYAGDLTVVKIADYYWS